LSPTRRFEKLTGQENHWPLDDNILGKGDTDMVKKRLLAISGLVLILSLTFLLVNQETSSASECRIIRINSAAQYQNVTLDPKTINANKGDCLIWYNNAGQSDVKISFEEGKKCTDVLETSMDFQLDAENCLVTKTYIPPRGTASFVFDKEGSFEYVAEVKGTALRIKGTVKVK
jgi:hypothetical protein